MAKNEGSYRNYPRYLNKSPLYYKKKWVNFPGRYERCVSARGPLDSLIFDYVFTLHSRDFRLNWMVGGGRISSILLSYMYTRLHAQPIWQLRLKLSYKTEVFFEKRGIFFQIFSLKTLKLTLQYINNILKNVGFLFYMVNL